MNKSSELGNIFLTFLSSYPYQMFEKIKYVIYMNQKQNSQRMTWSIILGIGLGSLVGALTDNYVIGIGVGLSLGLAVGSLFSKR